MEIKHISERPESIPEIAAWIENEWGHDSVELTFDNIYSTLLKQVTIHQIPETFVAVENGKFLGTASIVEDDMSTRPGLTPWLASVFVDPEFRNKGVGSELVKTIMKEAKIIGIKKLYLWTANKMDFYSKLGWNFFEQTEYRGKIVTIMSYEC